MDQKITVGIPQADGVGAGRGGEGCVACCACSVACGQLATGRQSAIHDRDRDGQQNARFWAGLSFFAKIRLDKRFG